jgi:hypothetical protein
MPMLESPEVYNLDSELELEEAFLEAGTSTRENQDFSVYSSTEPHLASTLNFSRHDENIFAPAPHEAWINLNICEGNE